MAIHHPATRFRIPRALLLALVMTGLLAIVPAWGTPGAAGAAAPALALAPASGRCGTSVTARGTGFPASLPVVVQRGTDNGPILGRGTTARDGTFSIALGTLCDSTAPLPNGSSVAVVASPDASRGAPAGNPLRVYATFTVTTGTATPTITLDPSRGRCGSQVTIRGKGFSPREMIDLTARRTTPPAAQGAQLGEARTDADGAFAVTLPLLGCADDPNGAQVTINALRRPADPRDGATLLVSAVFTVERAVPANGQCFRETDHCVQGRFLEYWRSHGLDLGEPGISSRESLALFGYPLSDEFEQRLEDGKTYRVQYFERARMEYHPEHADPRYQVLLGQFGRQILAAVPGAPTTPARPADGTRYSRYFVETRHNTGGRFLEYWELNGGLAVFGYPLSEEFEERLEDGRVYRVQYFERARFEYHPENPVPYDVLLGQFGRTILVETTER